jgi:hypothetical protein
VAPGSSLVSNSLRLPVGTWNMLSLNSSLIEKYGLNNVSAANAVFGTTRKTLQIRIALIPMYAFNVFMLLSLSS